MLQADLLEADYYSQFELEQLNEILVSSSPAGGSTPILSPQHLHDSVSDPSKLQSLEMLASVDFDLAQALVENDLQASVLNARDHQMAQKLGAETSKMALDREFARRLQQMDEGGQHDLDWDELRSLEGVLGSEEMRKAVVSWVGSNREERRGGRCLAVCYPSGWDQRELAGTIRYRPLFPCSSPRKITFSPH